MAAGEIRSGHQIHRYITADDARAARGTQRRKSPAQAAASTGYKNRSSGKFT
ncbi:hypothetical protein H715_02964 [Brucella ovis IntaBari-2002-82-58]|nr:hypothetical protein H713_02964 [Brucella ovis IntaBari-2010-47-268]ENT91789.1 hypothetical protein H715_02964 [Brucella ovis IntaBari-2002-82-58]